MAELKAALARAHARIAVLEDPQQEAPKKIMVAGVEVSDALLTSLCAKLTAMGHAERKAQAERFSG